jgi:hypothetical protein
MSCSERVQNLLWRPSGNSKDLPEISSFHQTNSAGGKTNVPVRPSTHPIGPLDGEARTRRFQSQLGSRVGRLIKAAAERLRGSGVGNLWWARAEPVACLPVGRRLFVLLGHVVCDGGAAACRVRTATADRPTAHTHARTHSSLSRHKDEIDFCAARA